MKKRFWPWIAPAVIILTLVIGRLCFFHTLRIEGTSMNNTLKSGDIVLVLKMRSGDVERGEIVECRFPMRDGTYIKRVIGLPGERIDISGGKTYIDGNPLQERYVSSMAEDYAVELGEDEYLLLGDNRAESYDSRAEEIGPAHRDDFTGRVIMRLWPFKSIS